MVAEYRAGALANDGSSAATTNSTFTIPAAAVADDVVLTTVQAGNETATLTTPTGWTLLASGPNLWSGTATQTWLFLKTLASGEPGSSVAFTFGGSVRNVGQMSVYSGVDPTGILVATPVDESTLGNPQTVPTIGSVPANALIHTSFCGTKAVPIGDLAVGTPFSQGANTRVATAFASGADLAIESAYRVVPSAGTYGGETFSWDTNTRRFTYAVALPAVGASSLDKIKAGAAVPILKAGALTVDRVYAGSVQVYP